MKYNRTTMVFISKFYLDIGRNPLIFIKILLERTAVCICFFIKILLGRTNARLSYFIKDLLGLYPIFNVFFNFISTYVRTPMYYNQNFMRTFLRTSMIYYQNNISTSGCKLIIYIKIYIKTYGCTHMFLY